MKANDTIFPITTGKDTLAGGLTKREAAILNAHQGLLASGPQSPDSTAELAIRHADALIARLKKEEG